MNSLNLDKECLEAARKQFCLDIGLPWEEYEKNREKNVLIQKTLYAPGTMDVAGEGARNYAERNSFFRAIICLGQLLICCDEKIYDWVVEQYTECKPEWFCNYRRLRKLDEKLREFGQEIFDTHVYFLPEARGALGEGKLATVKATNDCSNAQEFVWYEQEELLKFKENNRFTSALTFWERHPDMLAVVAMKEEYRANIQPEKKKNDEEKGCVMSDATCKDFDQTHMCGMAGASRDGEYLWQIGINVDKDCAGQGLGHKLVRTLKDEILRRGKVPFYGTSESHTLSRTVGLKAGFVPAWTEISSHAVEKK